MISWTYRVGVHLFNDLNRRTIARIFRGERKFFGPNVIGLSVWATTLE